MPHVIGEVMETVRSADGTPIAYDQAGHGPALIVVDGALSTRSGGTKPQLAGLLAARFTVLTYDRRGRGDSGDTQPYAVEREIEDIEALLDRVGRSGYLYGHSSGGCLALDAALRLGPKVGKLAIYEAPYNDDPGHQPVWTEYLQQLAAALADNRRGDAVALFMRLVGMPAEQVDAMRRTPSGPAWRPSPRRWPTITRVSWARTSRFPSSGPPRSTSRLWSCTEPPARPSWPRPPPP